MDSQMTLTVRDIKEREKEGLFQTFELSHNQLPAVIKSVAGTTRPVGMRSMTWVAFYNQPESMALVHNSTAMDVEGTPVWIGPAANPPHGLEIKGIYLGGVSEEVDHGGGALASPPHAQTHQYPSESNKGPDPMLVYQPALQPLKMTGNGLNLTVTVQPHLYQSDGKPRYFPGANLDLTSSVPSTSGTVRKTLVYLDEATRALAVVDSVAVPIGGSRNPTRTTLPIGGRMIGYVELTYGQTAITTVTHIEDWRDTLGGRTNVSSATTISPHLQNTTYEVEFVASATGAVTLSFLDANVHDITLTGNTTLVIDDPPSNLRYGEMKIIAHQDSTGGRTLTWPINIWWPGASTPTMSSAADAVDMYEIVTLTGGLYYLGRALAAYGPSAQTVTADVLSITGTARSITVDATGPVVTVSTLTLIGSALTITIDAGVLTVTVSALTLTGTPETITAAGGPVSVTMNVLTLTGTPETITATNEQVVTMSVLTLTGTPETITATGGPVSVTMSVLALTGTPETISVGVIDNLLLETGDALLLETGDNLLLE